MKGEPLASTVPAVRLDLLDLLLYPDVDEKVVLPPTRILPELLNDGTALRVHA